MDYSVNWSTQALADVEAIAEYIARDSPRYAQTVVDKFIECSQGLRSFPRAGRAVPELGEDTLRERIVYS